MWAAAAAAPDVSPSVVIPAAASADVDQPRGSKAAAVSERDPSRGVARLRGEAGRVLGQEGDSLLLLEGEGQAGLRGERLLGGQAVLDLLGEGVKGLLTINLEPAELRPVLVDFGSHRASMTSPAAFWSLT